MFSGNIGTNTGHVEKLQYISESVIERLRAGTFVAKRRSKPESLKMQERRDSISPLAVSKRCVRYDHHVFLNRKDLIIDIAESLNSPQKKLVLLAGPQGCGKTSLTRGIIELMGGGQEQLLWFDVNAHTDYDEIIIFLIQYITYICNALRIDNDDAQTEAGPDNLPDDPFEKLEALVLKVSHIPLLIVIDNVEHIVNPEHRIHSYPLKETLNFLLSFPNIKMILCGERLPYADMSTNSAVITEIKLSGLSEKDVLDLLQEEDAEEGLRSEEQRALLTDLYRKTQGFPWLLKILYYLKRRGDDPLESLQELNALLDTHRAHPVEGIARYIYDRLTPLEKDVAQVLTFLRHPADFSTVIAISRYCKPELAASAPENFREILDHSVLKPLMKRTFPPQAVLDHIRNRHQPPSEFQPWYEFYRQIKKLFYQSVPPAERGRIHRLLQDFYLKEKNKPFAERVYQVKSKALVTEARFHGNASRQRRTVFTGNRDVSTQSYLYSGIRPVSGGQRPPVRQAGWEPAETAVPGEILPEEELAPRSHVEEYAEGPASENFSWDELELTDEEKALLARGEKMTPESEAPARSGSFFEHLETAAREDQIWSADTPEPAPEDETSAVFIDDTDDSLVADTPFGETSGKAPKTQTLVASGLSIEETDPVEQQIQQKLVAAVASHNRRGMVHHLASLARHRSSKGLFSKAEDCLTKALELKQYAGSRELSDIYTQLGTIHKETYRHNSAMDYIKQAIRTFEDMGEMKDAGQLSKEGRLYQDLGDIHAFRGQHHDAIGAFYKALEDYSAAGEAASQAEVYFKLAQVYDVMGMPENAINYYEQSFSLDQAQGNDVSCAATLANIGSIHLEAGRLAEALGYFERSLVYDRRQENAEGEYKTLDLIAQVHLRQKRWQQADTCYQNAMAIALKEDNNTWKANVYLKLGNLHRQLGNWQKALDHYQSAKASAPLSELSDDSRRLLDEKIEETQRAIRQQSV